MATTTRHRLILLCAEPDCTCEACGIHARFVLQWPSSDPERPHRMMLCNQHLQELAHNDGDLLSKLINGLAFWLEQQRVMILA